MTKTTEEIGEDILAALPESETPPELEERLLAFHENQGRHVQDLRMALLSIAAGWIEGGEEAGLDRELLDRVAAYQLIDASALVTECMKRRMGEPSSPARFAIVAYDAAEWASELPAPQEMVEEAKSAFDGMEEAV